MCLNRKFFIAWIVLFIAWLHNEYEKLQGLFRSEVEAQKHMPLYMIYYIVQPMPGLLAVKQIVFDGILVIVLGVIVAFVYRPSANM